MTFAFEDVKFAAEADAEGLVDDSTTDREFETEVGRNFEPEALSRYLI